MAYEDVFKSIKIKDRIGFIKGASFKRHNLPLTLEEHEVENRIARVETFGRLPGIAADATSATPATLAVSNKDFEVGGNNMTTALTTAQDDGGILLTPDGGNTDGAHIKPHTQARMSTWGTVKWNTNKKLRFSTRIRTGAKIDNLTIVAGMKLTDTTVLATDDDQMMFYHKDDGDNWRLITSNDGDDENLDSGVAVAVNKEYEFVIEVGADRRPVYYIDNVKVGTGAALKANTDLIPVIATLSNTDASTTKTLAIRYLAASRDY